MSSYTVNVADGTVERVWSAEEVLEMLREILPFADDAIESRTYCLYDPEKGLSRELQDIHALLRRAYEMAGIEPWHHSALHWERWRADYRRVTERPTE